MITAHLGTDQLDLSDDFSIEIVQVSQLFNFDKLKGSYIASISFPPTERNQNRFNHPNRFELRRNGAKIYEDVVLRSDGFLLIRGTLELTDQFSGNIYGEVGVIAASQQEKFITDADLPTAQTFNNKTSFDPATDDYCAPFIQNPDFFKDIGPTKVSHMYYDRNEPTIEETLFQFYHRMLAASVNYRSGGTVLLTTDSLLMALKEVDECHSNLRINVVTPMLYLFPAIEQILKTLHFFFDSSDISTDNDLMHLCIYNNKSIVDYLFETVETQEEIDDPYMNVIQPQILVEYCNQQLSTFNYSDLLPRISLKEFLVSIQNLLNIAFVFYSNKKYKIVDREYVLFGHAIDDDVYFTETWKLKGKKSSIIKFITEHDSNDFYFSSFYQDLSERESDFGADVANWEALLAITTPTLGELRRVIANHSIYEYNTGTVTTQNGDEIQVVQWFFISLDFQPLKYNQVDGATETLEVKTTASTVAYSNSGNVKQIGRCNLRKDTEAGFSLRLVFDESNVGKNNTSNYMLNWRYDNNLLETRWKNTAKWLANREAVEGYFRFPINVYANYDINTKHRTRAGEFIIDRMVTKFSHAGIGETKIEGWKK
jgi:hypothetical protein